MNADLALEGLRAIRDALPDMLADGRLLKADWYDVAEDFKEGFVDWPDGFENSDWTPAIALNLDTLIQSTVEAENDDGDTLTVAIDHETAMALAQWFVDAYEEVME